MITIPLPLNGDEIAPGIEISKAAEVGVEDHLESAGGIVELCVVNGYKSSQFSETFGRFILHELKWEELVDEFGIFWTEIGRVGWFSKFGGLFH